MLIVADIFGLPFYIYYSGRPCVCCTRGWTTLGHVQIYEFIQWPADLPTVQEKKMHTRKSRASSKIGATTYGESITQLRLSLFCIPAELLLVRHHRCKNPRHTHTTRGFFWLYKTHGGMNLPPPWVSRQEKEGRTDSTSFLLGGPFTYEVETPCCSSI